MSIKAPKNLKVVRKEKGKFRASWKLGQNNYSDQELQWRECYKSKDSDKKTKLTDWKKASGDKIKKKTTSYDFEIDFTDYPMTGSKRLYKIIVRVRGKKGSSYSSWATFTFQLKKPKKPDNLIKPANLGEGVNSARYEWSVGDSGKNIFYRFQYQVAERLNFRGSKLEDKDIAWANYSVSKVDNYNKSYLDMPVSALPVPPDNLTQFFRVRSYGPRGFSDWVTSYHVFGEPQQASISVDHCVVRESTAGYNITLYWKSEQHKYGDPIDSVVVQYAFGTPIIQRTVESGSVIFELVPPSSGIQWKSCDPLVDTSDASWKKKQSEESFFTDTLSFDTDGRPNAQECIFVRVNNLHDTELVTTEGETVILKLEDSSYGRLDTPTLSSVEYNPDPDRPTVQITADNPAASTMPNCYLAVLAKDGTDGSAVSKIIGILTTSSGTFRVPDDIAASENRTFGIKAYVATYSPASPSATDATEYFITTPPLMESDEQWEGGTIARPPALKATDIGDGVALVEWDWSWVDAQSAELSWSQNKYAWESTDEPTTYIVSNNKAGRWRISGLDFGEWWIRIRLIRSGNNYETYGLYSDPVSVTLAASAPPTPILVVDPTTVAPDGEIRCTWAYAATDGSSQNQAEIVEIIEGQEKPRTITTISDSSQSCIIYTNQIQPSWAAGTSHKLAIRTYSSYSVFSDYSSGIDINIAEPLVASVTLGEGFVTVPPDPEEGETEPTYLLTQFPFSVAIEGAGDNGTTSMYIRRADGHPLNRPDESRQYGFENETIVLVSEDADGLITVDTGENSGALLGTFDDTEQYILTATAVDEFGQKDDVEVPFTVNWDTKAYRPFADIDIDYDRNAAIITPTVVLDPSIYDGDEEDIYPGTNADATEDGALCDIYRLTSGKPEIVVSGAIFGETYVDPYPAIGRFGGYRLVYRSVYGDYITPDNGFAWTDYDYEHDAALKTFNAIIDFEDDQISVPFDLDISHTWKKEFIETKYLGGAVQGDWNEGVSHTMKVSTTVSVEYQSDTYRALRRLADYAGVCHIRTPDSSSFAANIDVSETQEQKKINMIASFTFDITRVDQEEAAGMTYAEWIGE